MKLLVLAQIPPPVHGQSAMVKILIDGLPARGIPVHHVNLRLSRDAADIGRWRLAKMFGTLGAAARAVCARFRHGSETRYYVPAPGKRGALYRDWLLMLLCRPFFSRLVLHWHAVGLGEWLTRHATTPERAITRWLLGHADVSIVLAPELADDAQILSPRRVAVVPNCAPDPGEPAPRPARGTHAPMELLFLGQCSHDKGLFSMVEAIALANVTAPGSYRLTVAGGFADRNEAREFEARVGALPANLVRYVGVVGPAEKDALFRSADLFCFPTRYPHEGQPVTLIEALAHDVPILTTRWRAIPGMLPDGHVWFVEAGNVPQLAEKMRMAIHAPSPAGRLRAHYLAHFTEARHLAAVANALRSLV